MSCPADVPACGLQTTLRNATDANGNPKQCDQCYTRFRYSADIGAIYWNIWQIQKKCVEAGTPCNNTACYCTVDPPYYQGELRIPDGNGGYTIETGPQYCSVWAKSACRRKVYKCVFHLADYVVTTFQDYEIKFCSIGPDTPECSGCVACKNDDCLYPVIHASKAIDPKTGAFSHSPCLHSPSSSQRRPTLFNLHSLSLASSVAQPVLNLHVAQTTRMLPTTTAVWSSAVKHLGRVGTNDDCWPQCDPTQFHKRIVSEVSDVGGCLSQPLVCWLQGWASMGFYVPASSNQVIIEEVIISIVVQPTHTGDTGKMLFRGLLQLPQHSQWYC
eukprot:765577-Hanusia_phi.AAC.3